MRKLLFVIFLLIYCVGWSQIRFCSWNLCDMGKSKSTAEVAFMAETLKDFDVVAIQEVVAGPEGAKAVSRLADALNRTGSKWDYRMSEPTIGNGQKRERYAFFWKTAVIAIKGKAWLDGNFSSEIEREPFLATFKYGENELTIVNFHAITKKLQPEREIKYFRFYPEKYRGHNLVFAGDFNCPQSHTVFNPIKKMRYNPVFLNAKTTLRTKCIGGDCLASEFDNIFYQTDVLSATAKGVVPFYKEFPTLKEARKISDHLPVWVEIRFK